MAKHLDVMEKLGLRPPRTTSQGMDAKTPKIPEKVGKNYKIIRKLGEGTFGEIYEGINIKTNIEVAIKLEPENSEHKTLFYELKIYKRLHNYPAVIDKGIPNVYYG